MFYVKHMYSILYSSKKRNIKETKLLCFIFNFLIDKVTQNNSITVICIMLYREQTVSLLIHSGFKIFTDVPEIVIIPSTKLTVQVNDDNVHLMCSVIDANPNTDLKFVWTKDGTQIGTRQNYTIVSVDNADRGTYTCTCSNTAGASAPASVIVNLLGEYSMGKLYI